MHTYILPRYMCPVSAPLVPRRRTLGDRPVVMLTTALIFASLAGTTCAFHGPFGLRTTRSSDESSKVVLSPSKYNIHYYPSAVDSSVMLASSRDGDGGTFYDDFADFGSSDDSDGDDDDGDDDEESLEVDDAALASFRSKMDSIFDEDEDDGGDAGIWGTRSDTPDSLQNIKFGSRRSEFDDKLIIDDKRDAIYLKKMPSAFFETPLQSYLVWHQVDTLILTGGSTSGCIRATAVDSLSRGYRTIVPEECVADKHESYHFANLTDLLLKYADVVSVSDVFEWLNGQGV